MAMRGPSHINNRTHHYRYNAWPRICYAAICSMRPRRMSSRSKFESLSGTSSMSGGGLVLDRWVRAIRSRPESIKSRKHRRGYSTLFLYLGMTLLPLPSPSLPGVRNVALQENVGVDVRVDLQHGKLRELCERHGDDGHGRVGTVKAAKTSL